MSVKFGAISSLKDLLVMCVELVKGVNIHMVTCGNSIPDHMT